jgi:monothiol glutaredoxin
MGMTFNPDEPDLTANEVRDVVEETIETEEIALFIKGTRHMPQCGYSDKALSLTHHYRDEDDIAVVDILQNMGAFREEREKRSGWETIPQAFVDGEFVGGSDILTELAERGELGETLNAPDTEPPEFGSPSNESSPEAPF